MQGKRRAVKIAARNNIPSLGKDERIIGRRSRFNQEHIFTMRERTANRAVNLRHAAQTVRVLNAWIAIEMGLPEFASSSRDNRCLRDGLLAGMRPGVLKRGSNAVGVPLAPPGSSRRKRPRHARAVSRAERQPADRMHRLCSI